MSAAAVLGRSFDLSLVRGTTDPEETITALGHLVRRGIVRGAGCGPQAAFDFVHARLRKPRRATSLARRRLSTAVRRTCCRPFQAAEIRVGSSSWPGTSARGRDADAAETFREASLSARALYANREAASHLETALALGHPDIGGIQLALARSARPWATTRARSRPWRRRQP